MDHGSLNGPDTPLMASPEPAVAIGKIERVPLRAVWPHEAHNLTTWLEENPDVLNDALGLSITSVERERSAGAFSVDLLGQDASNHTVVIENQLERSDHDHLGKLVTYVAFFEARVAVWIVADPRPEHVGAVVWLNQSSPADFYLVKIEGIRIAGSPPAPLLTLIVGPSPESREAGEVKKERAERQELLHRFWAELLARAKDRTKLYSAVSPADDYWISTGIGMGGLLLNLAVRRHDGQVELYIDRGPGKDSETTNIFEALLAAREEIEAAFGGALDWQPLPIRRACRIRTVISQGGYLDEESWPGIQDDLIDAAIRMEAALRPRIAALTP